MITAMIASIPDREDMLKKTIESLRPQVDQILVALNNYERVPEFIFNDTGVVMLDNKMGDAGKFYFADQVEGHVLTCDDDIIYPPDYASYMIKAVDKYKCPVTLHGKTYEVGASFGNPTTTLRCLDDVFGDGRVDVGGTGVMCYHTDHIKVRYEDFKIRNMADLWFAKLCKEQGVRIMCLEHKKGNLVYQGPKTTIWEEEKNKGFAEQTEVLKSFIK